MVAVGFIEVLDRGGRVVQRVRLESFPLSIGRAYCNDVILEDRYVSPQHLRIDRDDEGNLIAEDLSSLNGSYRLPSGRRIERVRLIDDARLRVGQTELRFRASGHEVDEAQPYAGDDGLFKSPGRAAIAVALGAAYLMGLVYLHSFQKIALLRQMAQLVPLTTIILLWALAWSVAGRVSSQRFHFVEHCAVAVLAGVALSILDQITDYVAFAFNAESSGRFVAWGGSFVVLSGLLYAHSRLCAAESSRRLFMRTTGVALLVMSLTGLVRFAESNEITLVPSLLKPPGFRVTRARSIDEFLERSKNLQERVDDLVHQKSS
ncbi:MAG TPA: FHA domain-containing protein [Candidatus Acidoferrales bacterium]|nr:FHA domain-containing protein [Candidatus Acidoferrales bacterium]